MGPTGVGLGWRDQGVPHGGYGDDVWALLRTGRWISFTIAALIVIIAFGLLSVWQWHRATEKREDHLAVLAEIGQAAVPLDTALAQEQDWAHVTLTGTWTSEQLLVRNRPLYGRPGFWVISAFREADSDRVVWVARGWLVQSGTAAAVVEPPPAPAGEVQVNGYLHRSDNRALVAGENIPQGQISVINVAELNQRTSRAVTDDWYVQAETDPVLEHLPLPEPDDVQNLSCAGQWLLFALIVVGGWFYFLRREAKEPAAGLDLRDQEVSSRTG